MFVESLKFIIYSALIVIISKYALVTTLRKLAESLNLKAKTVGDVARMCNINARIFNNSNIKYKRTF